MSSLMTDEDVLSSVTAAAHAAGSLLADEPRPPLTRTLPEFFATFRATEAPAAELLRKSLDQVRPGVAWLDEFDTTTPAAGEVWVVDVMDGAVQYLQGMPYWCVSVTLLRAGRPAVAVLHHPETGETYGAIAGLGAWRDGESITPSLKDELAPALLATSSPPGVAADPDAVRRAGRSLSAALAVAGAVRNLGPTSWQIAEVAGGRIDGFWQYGADAPNLLGASLIAAEAGAAVSDAEGRPWTPESAAFVAAAPGLQRPILDFLSTID